MENAVWDRLSAEIRREVDSLVPAGRNVRAIALMRELGRTWNPTAWATTLR